jgi:hypothetical protein
MSGNRRGRIIRVALALGKKDRVRYANGFMFVKGKDKAGKKKLWQVKKIEVAAGG